MGIPGHISASDILALWKRQPSCVVCGNGRGIDHIRALADGGAHDVVNLQTMCKPCNRSKEHVARRMREAHRINSVKELMAEPR
jgi:5-methylcytosine-specific restriction endonuclease McrA